MGVGLVLAITAGVVGWRSGGPSSRTVRAVDRPVIGDIKVSTLLAFDLGVYIVVVGLVTTAIFKLGSDPS